MSEPNSSKAWPGEPPGLWPAPEPMPRNERRSDAKRIEIVRQGFRIDHANSRRLTAKLTDFVERPWEPHQRWRGLLLVGPARSGRSWLVSHWLSNRTRGTLKPVLTAGMPTDVDGDRIQRALLEATGPYAVGTLKGHQMRARTYERLEGVEAVVLDGCDHLAQLTRPRLWRLLARIKAIAERARVPMILVVSPQILQVMTSDPDWESRFEVAYLPKWRVDRDFLDLLTAWENELPLQKNSRLADRELALHLYSLCDGSIGRLSDVLREATLAAIGNAGERVTIRLLDSLGLSPPQTFRSFLF